MGSGGHSSRLNKSSFLDPLLKNSKIMNNSSIKIANISSISPTKKNPTFSSNTNSKKILLKESNFFSTNTNTNHLPNKFKINKTIKLLANKGSNFSAILNSAVA